ncbi:hypothetical protein EVC45_14915 [Paraburkholderia sp. UYCP14C]|uniref:hypothetical protein n=1 Tax=Paraburkholderia sp. UYCP14C TaxID=2511130 RepID=UPI0010226B8B|nr:hypothetical protein [Paraburkholderia sp. UYCP14C]RZF29099.1 hypothetical protein EVC45_14915 [Paraburkholderia sp. UYCP14C]
MGNIEALLGMRYDDLPSSPIFAEVTVPPREVVIDQSYVSCPELGLSLVLPDNEMVGAVHLHADKHEGFAGFASPLPRGLGFHMSRSEVRATLGVPEKSGEEKEVLLLGKKPAWDSFIVGEVRLHVEYLLGINGIQLITLTKR